MTVYISAKQIKKRGNPVAACPCELKRRPGTLSQLITMLVSDGVERYNRRVRGETEASPLTQEQIEDMGHIGRIAFGIPYGSREAEAERSIETAIQGFADGLYRVFIGDREIESLDAPLSLEEGDTVTIIRLVMLTGGYF